jgi:hypothetical protein
MTTILVATRPERTAAEIAGDRKAAAAFWARLEKYKPTNPHHPHPTIRRGLERELFDYKLLLATAEATGSYYALRPVEISQRRWDKSGAYWMAAHPLENRIDANLKPYVTAGFKATMPEPRIHPPVKIGKKHNATYATRFLRVMTHRFEKGGIELVTKGDLPFEQWLLRVSWYGPVRTDVPDIHGFLGKRDGRSRRQKRVPRGHIRPVGMSETRALEIAISVAAR